MRQYLNENDTVGEIRQSRRHPTGKNYIWVLVEGITDQKLYAKLIDGQNTKVEMVHGGVEKLREVLSILNQETQQVLGIRDADFLHLENKQEIIENLFLTDVHDSEMMMLSCDKAFEAIVAEYIPFKRKKFSDLRAEILISLSFLSGIRWINAIECLELNFKSGLAKFYNSESLLIDKQKCIIEIEKCSPNKKRSLDIVEIDSKTSTVTDYYNLCNGHDFESAFALHVTKITTNSIKDKNVGEALRLSYRKEDFALTALYASLKNWEQQTGYCLFQEIRHVN
jgi:hypothetical protein